jgi:hypothetical protein
MGMHGRDKAVNNKRITNIRIAFFTFFYLTENIALNIETTPITNPGVKIITHIHWIKINGSPPAVKNENFQRNRRANPTVKNSTIKFGIIHILTPVIVEELIPVRAPTTKLPPCAEM